MTPQEHTTAIEAIATAMRKCGVAQYQSDGLVIILGPAPFVGVAADEPPTAEEIAARHERVLYAASEGA